MCSMAKMKESTNNILKEFLAQGYSRLYGDKDIPKNRVIPAYLHLNTEVIESIELVASMLLEIPYTLMEGGRITSKTFKRFTYEYEKNVPSLRLSSSLKKNSIIGISSTQLVWP